MADIEMPQLGETVTEGTITKWFKNIGDPIAEDEVLFEVSTDKVDSEVPSPVAGFLSEIRVPEGETVDVGTILAVVSAEAPTAAPPVAPATQAAVAPTGRNDDRGASPSAGSTLEPEPRTRDAVSEVTPKADKPVPAPAPAPTGVASGIVLSPLVRKLMADNQLTPAQVNGTGLGGRITRDDVERVIAGRGPAARRGPVDRTSPSRPHEAERPPAPKPRSGTGDTVEKLNNMRRITGDHMVMSKATAPHAMTAVEVDYENVERVRNAHHDAWLDEEGFSLTYLPFISRAVVDALHDFPHMNASMGDGELVVHNYVNLAIAVDLNFDGLLAPVIHEADDKRLRAVARDIHEIADRARTKRLSADDITGGTFTISNSGPFGTFMVIPVINQPQVAILSTDAVKRKPIVVTADDGTEAIAIHSVGMLAMSWDHRAFDGAYAAAFLREVQHIIENRDWESELA